MCCNGRVVRVLVNHVLDMVRILVCKIFEGYFYNYKNNSSNYTQAMVQTQNVMNAQSFVNQVSYINISTLRAP